MPCEIRILVLGLLTLASAIVGCAPTGRAQTIERAADALEVWAFHAPWDQRSARSAGRHEDEIDVLVSGWVALDTVEGQPLVLYPDTLAGNRAGTRYAALITSWLGDRFHPATIIALADNDAALARTAGGIATHAAERGYAALVLDFEGHESDDLSRLTRVADAIADSARARGVREIVLCIPAVDSAYPPRELLRVVDAVLPMLYDEHWSTSGPGPVSSSPWVHRALERRVAEAGPSTVVAGLPTYGYWWRPGVAVAQTVGIADAQRLIAEWGVPIARDPASGTLTARSAQGELWVTDAELLADLLRHVRMTGVRRVALWRLGLEDDAFWTVLRSAR